ncbi:MAG: STAS/SEC14 domain-containing protein [Candidatus Aminicenantes bacterium]|jgi:hypothetical protein
MKEKDGEIRIGESRYYLGEDNIVYVTEVGEIDDQKAMAIKDAFLKFLAASKGKLNILVDLNKAKKPSVRARKIFSEITENKSVDKVAHFGVHPVARVMASFIMGVSKKKELRFFKTKEEALAWLKE